MTDNIVSIREWLAKKKKDNKNENIQVYRDSLDNYKVMENYKIKTQERTQKIAESIKRINALMTELKKENT